VKYEVVGQLLKAAFLRENHDIRLDFRRNICKDNAPIFSVFERKVGIPSRASGSVEFRFAPCVENLRWLVAFNS
jgi:hypothetical protein